MKLRDLAEATQILMKYASAEEQYCIYAEHDELWIGSDSWLVTTADKVRLEELGFTIDEEGMGLPWLLMTGAHNE